MVKNGVSVADNILTVRKLNLEYWKQIVNNLVK